MDCCFDYDLKFVKTEVDFIIGVDEVGRGCLAGPVFACACAVPRLQTSAIKGIRDSKKIRPKERESIVKSIESDGSLIFSVAESSVAEIDSINIRNASLLAMYRALCGLPKMSAAVLVDGNVLPKLPDHLLIDVAESVIGGDSKLYSVAAASIIAKVYRDSFMDSIHLEFPHYMFAKNKGYATKDHVNALNKFHPCVHHRKSFQPVKSFLEGL